MGKGFAEGVGGQDGTCSTNMAGRQAVPREVENILSWAETPKSVNYKDLEVQEG